MRNERRQLTAKECKNIMIFLVSIFYISGIGLLIYGGYQLYIKKVESKDFIETEAVYIGKKFDQEAYERSLEERKSDFNTDSVHFESSLYFKIYAYEVNGKKYQISTDYSSAKELIKEKNVKVKYNPLNPEDAYIDDFSSNFYVILFGLFFIFVTTVVLKGGFPFLKMFIDIDKETKKNNRMKKKEAKKEAKKNISSVSHKPYI